MNTGVNVAKHCSFPDWTDVTDVESRGQAGSRCDSC